MTEKQQHAVQVLELLLGTAISTKRGLDYDAYKSVMEEQHGNPALCDIDPREEAKLIKRINYLDAVLTMVKEAEIMEATAGKK